MKTDTPWTVTTLKQALDGADAFEEGEVSLDVVGATDPVLKVTFHDLGDMVVMLAVDGEQIITSTLLWPRAQVANPALFEERMLRMHKIALPLASLGIATLNGEDWYELFGAMTARSQLAQVVTEVRSIAGAALELAEDRDEIVHAA